MKFRYKKPLRKENYPALRDKLSRKEAALDRKASIGKVTGIVCCCAFTPLAIATFLLVLFRLSGNNIQSIINNNAFLYSIRRFMDVTLPTVLSFIPLPSLLLCVFVTLTIPVILSLIASLVVLIVKRKVVPADGEADAGELLQVRSMLSRANALSVRSSKNRRPIWVLVSLCLIAAVLIVLSLTLLPPDIILSSLPADSESYIFSYAVITALLIFVFAVAALVVDFFVSLLCGLRSSINTDDFCEDLRRRWLELDPEERAKERSSAPKVTTRDFISDKNFDDIGLSFAMSTLADGEKVRIVRFLEKAGASTTDAIRKGLNMPEVNEFEANIRELCEDGLLDKTVLGKLITTNSYALSERCLPLLKIIEDISRWGKGLVPVASEEVPTNVTEPEPDYIVYEAPELLPEPEVIEEPIPDAEYTEVTETEINFDMFTKESDEATSDEPSNND